MLVFASILFIGVRGERCTQNGYVIIQRHTWNSNRRIYALDYRIEGECVHSDSGEVMCGDFTIQNHCE